MAIRNATHVLKNSDIVNRPLPSTLLKGEPIVNTASGIVFFSGVTTSTNDWVPAGTGTTANFFEVGSNLYDLQLRHRLTKYDNVSGSGLIGKFLSGTTNGFVLADISSIVSVDTYVTGFTYSNNNITIKQNQGQSDLNVLINTMTGLTINGSLSATTYLGLPTDVRVTGGTPNNSAKTYTFTNNTGGTFTVTGLTDLTITGGTYSAGTAVFTNNTGGTFSITGFTTGSTNTDTYVTGGTVTRNQNLSNLIFTNNTGGTFTVSSIFDTFITGGTYSAGTLSLVNNSGNTVSVTGLTNNDTYTTGFTYTPSQNKLSILQNQGQPSLDIFITTVSGLTVTDLAANRLVYTTTSGKLITGTATFDGTDVVLPTAGSLTVGTGGIIIGSGGSAGIPGTGDLIVNGNLTVFGGSISAFTSQLYVEDPNITLNYNPTGNTPVTSIGAGWTIQDGNGINGGNVNLDIRAMNTFTGITSTQVPVITEYTGSTGYYNRGWVTQLNDIVIRSNNVTTPNGVRVLGEFDTLDGGFY